MAEPFYPFVEDRQSEADGDLPKPTSAARIAVYDDMTMPPRVVTVEPTDIRSYLEEITQTVFELAKQQGGSMPFMLIRELVENLIHAGFSEPAISILDGGQTIVISDQGPGIPNKEAALRPTFSSASKAMKRYIRGVGSGLPIVEEQMKLHNGTITIEDNLGHGTIVTVSLAHHDDATAKGQQAQQADGTTTASPTPDQRGQYPAQDRSQNDYQGISQTGAGMGMGAGVQNAGADQFQPQYQQYPQYSQYPQSQQYQQFQQYPQYQPHPQQYQPGMYQAQVPAGTSQYGYPYGAAQYPGSFGAPAGMPGMQPYPQMQGQPQQFVPRYPGDGYQQMYAGGGYGTAPAAYPAGQPSQGYPQGVPQAPVQTGEVVQPYQPAGNGIHPDRGIQHQQSREVVQLEKEKKSIIKLFSQMEKMGPTELNKYLGIPNATGTRRLRELAEEGYLTKSTQKYVLTGEGRRIFAAIMDSEG